MKRQFPLALAFLIGCFMAVQFFIPHNYVQKPVEEINQWLTLIWTAALILGTLSLARHLLLKTAGKKEGWGYAAVALVSLIATLVVGFGPGMVEFFNGNPDTFAPVTKEGSGFMLLFQYILAPMEATTFSLLAFYIASAAFRAFRARNFEAALLLIAATVIMIGRVPIGREISEQLPVIANFILDFPNTAAKRAIMIGVGLGMISTALKIILGIERGYLGDKG